MKVSEDILNLVPYKPGKPIAETQREYNIKEVYKLASNENPLGPSPKAVQAMQAALQELHRYPDPSCYELTELLSKKWSLAKNQLAYGNGSNEIIDILIRIYCEPGDRILTTQAAFIAYQICAQAARVKTDFVPLTADYRTDMAKLTEHLEKNPDIKIVFIPNPNNPTGTYVSKTEIEKFMQKFGNKPDLLIVFDEAYTEFVRAQDYEPALNYLKKYSNAVVIRTLSKVYGLAGLRVGVLAASAEVVDLYNRVRNPFNVNHLAQVAAVAALQDSEFIRASQQIVWEGLDYFYKKLKDLGLPFIESQGNFLLFDTLRDAGKMNEALLRKGIIMRPVQAYGFPTHLRLSVGLKHENEMAMKALAETLPQIPVK